MPESYSSLRDLKRAKGSAPSQGWQGPRTKWSGARDHSSSYIDPLPSASAPAPSSGNPYASSGNPYASSSGGGNPYASSSSQQQNLASGVEPSHSRTRDAGSRFAERYAGQRSYSSADPSSTPAAVEAPKRGNSWGSWLGGNKSHEPETHTQGRASPSQHGAHGSRPMSGSSSSSSTRGHAPSRPEAQKQSSWSSWLPGSHHEDEHAMPDRPRRGRYIPPSERKPGDPMFEPVKPPPRRGPRTSEDDDDEPDPEDNSWSAWAARQTKAANAVMQGASDKLNEGWDSVNDANKRDKVSPRKGGG